MLHLLHRRKVGASPLPRFLLGLSSSSTPEQSAASATTIQTKPSDVAVAELTTSHPWPEWTKLMGMLLIRGYLSSSPSAAAASCKKANHIRTACLNFARDRPDIFRYLPEKDILVMVGRGCPSVDRKVVNSAKRLRTFFGIEEANVCHKCSLRRRCERAYAKSHENYERRAVDIMRILLTFGLDLMIGSVDSKFFRNENIEASARKLLSLVLKSSAKELVSKCQGREFDVISSTSQASGSNRSGKGKSNGRSKGDWVCTKCNFVNFSKNLRCKRCNETSLEKLEKLRAYREHLSLKRGDWICSRCDFVNFAKSSTCLQCNQRPTDRKLNAGEWECASCSFINFRRNASCLRCEWKRPRATLSEISFSPFQQHELQRSTTIFPPNSRRQSRPSVHEESSFWSSTDDGSDIDDCWHDEFAHMDSENF